MSESVEVREQVRRRYAQAATVVATGTAATVVEAGACGCASTGAGSCCGPAGTALDQDESFGAALYAGEDTDALPAEAVLASLGCGNQRRSRTCTPVRSFSTSAPAAGSTCCCRPAGSAPAVTPTDWT